jgi:hypothetical protein
MNKMSKTNRINGEVALVALGQGSTLFRISKQIKPRPNRKNKNKVI